eukprot:14462849-Ditylum_brightwellii.AAC.1
MMEGLSEAELNARKIPDEHGWTKPIHDTDITVHLSVYTPDYSSEEAAVTNVNVGAPQKKKKKKNKIKSYNNQLDQKSRIDDVLIHFLGKANALLEAYIDGPTQASPQTSIPLQDATPLPRYIDTKAPDYQLKLKQKRNQEARDRKILSNPYC